MKAVIVEIKGKHAAVLTENGVVTKIRNKDYLIGQEIIINKNNHKLIRMTAAAAAAIMIFVTPAWAYLTPYSYVSIDVNPSFEFFINRFDRVLTVKAFNDDGREFYKNINIDGLKNKEIQSAVTSVLNELKTLGYIVEGEESGLIIAASSRSEEKKDILSEKLRIAVNEAVSQKEEQTSEPDKPEKPEITEKPDDSQEPAAQETEIIKETEEVTPNNKPEKPEGQDKAKAEEKPEKAEKPERWNKDEIQEKSDRWKKPGQEKQESQDKSEELKKWESLKPEKPNKPDRKKHDVEVIEVTKKEVDEAKKMGVTPGKLNLVGKLRAAAKEAGHEINSDEWLDESVKNINAKIKEYREESKQKEHKEERKQKEDNRKNNKNKSENNNDRDYRDDNKDRKGKKKE